MEFAKKAFDAVPRLKDNENNKTETQTRISTQKVAIRGFVSLTPFKFKISKAKN